jgi:hypothetical protein
MEFPVLQLLTIYRLGEMGRCVVSLIFYQHFTWNIRIISDSKTMLNGYKSCFIEISSKVYFFGVLKNLSIIMMTM